MRTTLFILFLFVTTTYAFGQIIFEKGYILTNENVKTECLIKNSDWKNNPNEIEYKLNNENPIRKSTVENIREFCITGVSRYVSAKVNIDRSANELDRLSVDRNPVWEEEQLFLKVLVDGKATLYYYEDGTLNRFFYSLNDSTPKQLIYKRYIYKESKIGENNGYQQQLWTDLRCNNITLDNIQSLNYKKDNLVAFFRKYNACMGSKEDLSDKKITKFGYNLTITPGVNFSILSAENPNSHTNIRFDNNINFSLGVEGEIILPYNKNKWGIEFNPSYQSIHASMNYIEYNMLTGQSFPKTAMINYSSIEFPIGVRYYMFLNKDVKLFLNSFYIPSLTLKLNKDLSFDGNALEIRTRDGFALGGGICYKKVNAEVRYYSKRDLNSDNVTWNTYYSRIAMVFGIKIF